MCSQLCALSPNILSIGSELTCFLFLTFILQRVARGYLAKRKAARDRAFIALAHAILTIQRSWRYIVWRRERISAAIKLQSFFRSRIAQRKYWTIRASSICLQSKYRQYRSTMRYNRTLKDIVLIQSVSRRWYCKTVVFAKRQRALECLQQAVRQWIALGAFRKCRARQRLQNAARQWLARRCFLTLREERRKLIENIIICQVRGHLHIFS